MNKTLHAIFAFVLLCKCLSISGQNKVSVTSGNWSSATTWSPSGVPTSTNNVTIANGSTVSINVDAQCNSLTVGTGGGAALLEYVGHVERTLNTSGAIIINSGSQFDVAHNSNVTHSLVVKSNLTNNGTLSFSVDAQSNCHTTFSLSGNIAVSGTGNTTFNTIALNMGSSASNIVNVTTSTFTVPANFLTLNNGTFKLSTPNAVTVTPYSGTGNIPLTAGFWLNSSNAVVNTAAGINLSGNLTVSGGTMNIGNATDEDLFITGGQVSISSGTMNVAGKLYASGTNTVNYAQTGGVVLVAAYGSTSTVNAPFQISGSGSAFNMSGGSIIVPREGGTGAQDFGFINTGSTSGAVTGGTLQLGNSSTPAAQTISINSTFPIGNLWLNSANATGRLITNTLSVVGNIAISTGTLHSNNMNLSLGGNWTNTAGTFTPGTAIVTFSSSAAQSLSKTGGETFNHLQFTGSGTKTFASAVTTSGNFSVSSGASVDVSASNYSLTIKGDFVNSGTFNARSGLIFFNGAVAQNISGSSVTNFFDITLNNNAGLTLQNGENLLNTLTLNNGTFSTNGKIFTMISTASRTARIAQITGSGNITGNVTVQRFAPGGTTGWALLGTCITSPLTLADWDDNIFISCASCPDGSAGGFLSIYTYDETMPGLFDDPSAYIPLSAITDPITPGKGYWVYLGTGSVTTSNITLDVTGQVRKFNYTIPLSYTNFGSTLNDGWNLIHNPYPSPIKWSLLKGATANIDNAVYAYNADLNGGAGGYATYINNISSPAAGSGGISDTIAIGQGFYVHSTGATALNAQESNKVGGNPTFLKTSSPVNTASSNPLLRLWLDGGGGYHDETVLYMQPGATDLFDDGYDAYKMRGQDPNAPIIALQKGTTEFQVNGVAPITGNFTMPLEALTGYNGTYTISAGNIGSFPAGACITLYDKLTMVTTDLKTSDYVCILSNTTTTARFDLNITINPLTISSTLGQPTCIAPNSGLIIAQGNNSGPWNYYWKDQTNAVVKTSLNKSSADTLHNIISGNYNVEVNTVGMCDNNTSSFVINGVNFPTAAFSSADTVDLNAGGIINFTNSSANAISYLWDFGDGFGTSNGMSPTYVYNTIGTYIVSMIGTSGSGCNDTAYKTVVVVNNAPLGIKTINSGSALLVKTVGENEFRVQQQLTDIKNCEFKLYDAIGRLIVDYGSDKTRSIDISVNLKNYNSGIYFLSLTINNDRKVIKLPVK